MSHPPLSIVVSTIGRPAAMKKMIASLSQQQDLGQFELVVVDQSDDRGCIQLIESMDIPFAVKTTTSGRGATVGRNVGTGLAQGWLLSFPDDNCEYEASTVASALKLVTATSGPDILAGLLVTPAGKPSMLRWPEVRTRITRRNVQQAAIEATTFIRRETFVSLGGFDESIGVGSPGPFQAGEITDLILRAIDSGHTAVFDPSVRIIHEDLRDVVEPGFADKMRGYGCGLGHLYRVHDLPRTELAYLVARKWAAAAVRTAKGRREVARADLAWARGLVSGYRITDGPSAKLRTPDELAFRDG